MRSAANVKNPQFRQLPIDYIVQQHLIWTQRFYDKYNAAQLDELIRNEMRPYCGEHSAFYAYIFSAIHVYRQKMINYEKKIQELNQEIQKLKQ